ncbi:MAG TPA: hypothetical protein VHT03_14635 [Rhizomicrobium sp.]|jgi:hypothetical protein|nr:hypothetical protein [Rhizomicrobium sp.]
MDFASWANWAKEAIAVDNWGVTPVALVAPLSLIVLMFVVRRFSQAAGPKTESRDLASAALITVIIVAAFLWIAAGISLLNRTFH